MNVLFVYSGNSKDGISPIVKNQGESLQKAGHQVDFLPIQGKGFVGYLKNVPRLRRFARDRVYDIIHAHYSLSALVALLAIPGIPVVASYMGCDTYGDFDERGRFKFSTLPLVLLSQIIQAFLDAIIVKSENLARFVYRKKVLHLIPNGVDLDKFVAYSQIECRKKLVLNKTRKYILFLGNPKDKRKNINLLQQALILLDSANYELLNPFPVSNDLIPMYLSAADVLVMTSFHEGSPNVIKEAMACNCPIVSTDAGDVKEIIGDTDGCYLTSFKPRDVAGKIELALKFSENYGRTKGRERIIELGLDSETVANKILRLYSSVLGLS